MIARASALALLAASHAAGAQSTREVRLDAGAAQVQQTGRDAHNAAGVFGVSWRESTPLFAALLSGAFTSAGDSASAAQAALGAAWRPSVRSPWQSEGGITAASFGVGSTIGQPALMRGGSVSGFVRERYAFESGGVWAGASLGGTTRDEIASHSSALELGAWWRAGEFEATASVSRGHSEDFELLEAASIFLSRDANAFDLLDVSAGVRFEHGPILLDATGTLRNGTRATMANQSAFYITAVWTFSPRFSFVAGTGRLLADPVRGVPDMQITSAAIRVALVPWRSLSSTVSTRAAFATLTPKASGALLLVRVAAGDSAHVEVAGSFSEWRPVPLTRTGDGWEAEIALSRGSHRVAVRVNGGPWQAPRGTARVKDEYGGEAGLIVVP